MEKKIKHTDIEEGKATITLKNGIKRVVPIKTTYIYFENGTNDCKIEIMSPLKLFGKTKEVN